LHWEIPTANILAMFETAWSTLAPDALGGPDHPR